MHHFSNRHPILPVTLVLLLILLTVFTGLRSQGRNSSQKKFDETQYPTVDEYTSKHETKTERDKSALKSKRFKMGMPVVSNPNIKVAAGVHEWPDNFSPIPVSESTAVIIGEITEAKANLSEDKSAVYSDFKIKPLSVLKNSGAEETLLTVTRYGGKVKFLDGNSLLVFKSGLGMPRVGRRYVLFLQETGDDADLLTAYELKNGKVVPLDSGTPNFSVYENVNEVDFLKVVQQKIISLSNLN